jgi:alpha-galactosidase
MGDWLSSSDQLGVPLHELLDQLADTGIDMALWYIHILYIIKYII